MGLMTISEVSQKFEVSTRMLRYYETKGLLSSTRIPDYAYRVYEEAAVMRLQQILLFRKLRIPVKQIAVILNAEEPRQALQVLQENMADLDEEMAALHTVRDILELFVSKLEKSIQEKIHLNLLEDSELLEVVRILSPSKTRVKDEVSMENLNKAASTIHKLTDKDVRIVYLPPAAVAAVHCVGDTPEADCIGKMRKFIGESHLYETEPDFRVYGFNHDVQNIHGYEHWITIPEDMELPQPFVKKHFCGGLYGAHMIPMGAFEEWRWFYEWVQTSSQYTADWNAPESRMGGCLEEHLNYIHLYDKSMEALDKIMQLDLLIPVKRIIE